jgi:hypothetical protein
MPNVPASLDAASLDRLLDRIWSDLAAVRDELDDALSGPDADPLVLPGAWPLSHISGGLTCLLAAVGAAQENLRRAGGAR